MPMRFGVAGLALILVSTPASAFSTPVLGGRGGGNYAVVCPAGSYLVEIRGKTGGWMDAVSISCGFIDPYYPGNAQGEFRFKPGAGAAFTSLFDKVVGGTGGGGWGGTACNFVDQVATGINVEIANNDGRTFVSDVRLECVRIKPPYDPASAGGIRGRPGAADTSYKDVGVLRCPSEQWAVGIQGTAGVYVDSIGLVCQAAFGPYAKPSPKPPVIAGPTERMKEKNAGILEAFGRFDAPTIDGNGVDICLHWGTSCGAPAADEFCRRKGFAGSTANTIRNDLPPTLVLGDNAVCTDATCDRFSNITCQ